MVRRPAVGAVVEIAVVVACSGFSDAVEAEVGPVVLVARVQQPAQLLTKTPESEVQRETLDRTVFAESAAERKRVETR